MDPKAVLFLTLHKEPGHESITLRGEVGLCTGVFILTVETRIGCPLHLE